MRSCSSGSPKNPPASSQQALVALHLHVRLGVQERAKTNSIAPLLYADQLLIHVAAKFFWIVAMKNIKYRFGTTASTSITMIDETGARS